MIVLLLVALLMEHAAHFTSHDPLQPPVSDRESLHQTFFDWTLGLKIFFEPIYRRVELIAHRVAIDGSVDRLGCEQSVLERVNSRARFALRRSRPGRAVRIGPISGALFFREFVDATRPIG